MTAHSGRTDGTEMTYTECRISVSGKETNVNQLEEQFSLRTFPALICI